MNTIETERLILRLYTAKDKEHTIALVTDPEVMKHVDEGVLTALEAAALWKKMLNLYSEGVDTIWAVFERDTLSFIGHATLRPRQANTKQREVGYVLRKQYWGLGYATEIAKRLIKYGFEEAKLSEVFAGVDDDHAASIHVLEKAGMKFRQYEYDAKGRYSIYSIANADLDLDTA